MSATRIYTARDNDLLVQYPDEHGDQLFYVGTYASPEAAQREARESNEYWQRLTRNA